jgi:uncharacterized membrane protein
MIYIIIGVNIIFWYCIIGFIVMFYFAYVTGAADKKTRREGKHVVKTPMMYIVMAGVLWIVVVPYFIWLNWKFRKK